MLVLCVLPILTGAVAAVGRKAASTRYYGLSAVYLSMILILYRVLFHSFSMSGSQEWVAAIVTLVTPIAATCLVARLSLLRERAWAAILVGPVVYLATLFVSVTVAVNVGALWL